MRVPTAALVAAFLFPEGAQAMSTPVKQATVDIPLGVAACTSPLWLPHDLNGWLQAVVGLGGVLLISVRIAVAILELRAATRRRRGGQG